MTPQEMEKSITYLLDRQAIYDVIATYSRGVDRLDKDILLSVYHPDAIDDHAVFVGGPEAFYDWVKQMHSTHHSSTQHCIGNHLAEIDGNVAHAETYFIWAGMNIEGAPFSLVGGRYIDRLEKRDGKWAIVERNCLTDWAAPSINTEEGAKTPEGAANYRFVRPFEHEAAEGAPRPTRDRSDPSYARPLTITKEREHQFEQIKRKHGVKPRP